MKQIETTKSGKNYKVINVGKFSDLMDYELPLRLRQQRVVRITK